MTAQKPNSLKAKATAAFDRIPMAYRQWVVLGVVFVLILVLLKLFMPSEAQQAKAKLPASPKQLENLLTPTDPRELGLGAVERELQDVASRNKELERKVKELEGRKPPSSTATSRSADDEILKRLSALEQGRASGSDNTNQPWVPQPQQEGPQAAASTPYGQRGPNAPSAQVAIAPIEMAIVTPPSPPPSEESVEKQQDPPGVYIPAGSIVSGVLLTGLDAPTGRSANRDPVPAVLRIKHEAILPNHRVAGELRECFVVLAGYGDLSSERAYMRSETLSCVRPDGKTVEAKVEGYITDETGSAGIRGRYVSKQGSVVAKAALAGLADGASRAFNSNQGYYGGGGSVTGEQLGTSGISGGVTTALDRVASYYLQLADQITGVIEVPPGRAVSLVVLRGTELKLMTTKR